MTIGHSSPVQILRMARPPHFGVCRGRLNIVPGLVEYVDYGTAVRIKESRRPCGLFKLRLQQANGLLEVNAAGHAIMRVETTPSVQNTRQSVRITTQSNYNGGLFVMQAVHMPTGCGVWP